MTSVDSTDDAYALLRNMGAPEHLVMHARLVEEVALLLLEELNWIKWTKKQKSKIKYVHGEISAEEYWAECVSDIERVADEICRGAAHELCVAMGVVYKPMDEEML